MRLLSTDAVGAGVSIRTWVCKAARQRASLTGATDNPTLFSIFASRTSLFAVLAVDRSALSSKKRALPLGFVLFVYERPCSEGRTQGFTTLSACANLAPLDPIAPWPKATSGIRCPTCSVCERAPRFCEAVQPPKAVCAALCNALARSIIVAAMTLYMALIGKRAVRISRNHACTISISTLPKLYTHAIFFALWTWLRVIHRAAPHREKEKQNQVSHQHSSTGLCWAECSNGHAGRQGKGVA